MALVGASVIAVAPITPTPPDIQIPNPLRQSSQAVQLTQDSREFEAFVNDVILAGTELGLTLTVPLTAALIEALAPDLIPEGLTSEAVATVLLLGLGGSAISGLGSIGTAIQDIFDAEGLDNILIAILVGAPSTIIQGFVLGGFGPDLTEVLLDAGVPIPPAIPLVTGGCAMGPGPACVPVTGVFAGGLINNPALLEVSGLQLVLLPVGAAPTEAQFILPGFFPTVGSLLEGLFGLFDPPSNGTSDEEDGPDMMSITSVDTSTQRLIPLDVTPQQGVDRGKGAATDLAQLPSNATDALEKTAAGATTGGPLGAVEDTLTTTTSKGPQVRSSLKFVPEIKASGKGGNSAGGSNPISDTLSSTATNLGDAVSNAVKTATSLGGEK